MNMTYYLPSSVRRFILDIPKLLARYADTAALAVRIEAMHLPRQLEHKFTVAVVGQMKAGKSTLLNALIGVDAAPVGVNECTATVNRFVYNEDTAQSSTFRVHWNNGDIEDLPLSMITDWVGTGHNAEHTRRIDLFSNAAFLQQASLIDTPGLRSLYNLHEHQARSVFDPANLVGNTDTGDYATLKEYDIADAIIYVLNPIEKVNDIRVLDLFSDQARFPGARSYNSIAVVQNWESRWDDVAINLPAVLARRCAEMHDTLKNQVTDVLPVSGLLARSLEWISESIWNDLLILSSSPAGAINKMTSSEDSFRLDKITESTFSVTVREELYRSISESICLHINKQAAIATTWPLVSFLVKLAHHERLTECDTMRLRVRELSGIDRLIDVLQRRFFQRAALIKTGRLLYQVWDPCGEAILRLDQLRLNRQQAVEIGDTITQILRTNSQRDADLDRAYVYVCENIDAIRDNLRQLEEDRRDLYALRREVQLFFQEFDDDLWALDILVNPDLDIELSDAEQSWLRRLFGEAGISLNARLHSTENNGATPDDFANEARRQHTYWFKKSQQSYQVTAKLCELATKRLKSILEILETSEPYPS